MQAAPIRGVVGRAAQHIDVRSRPLGAVGRHGALRRALLVGRAGTCGNRAVRQHGDYLPVAAPHPRMGRRRPRHGFPLPNTLVHGVVDRVFHTTISERGRVVGARFRPGGFTARFGRDAAALTGHVQPVDGELFGAPIHLDDDIGAASTRMDELIGVYAAGARPDVCVADSAGRRGSATTIGCIGWSR